MAYNIIMGKTKLKIRELRSYLDTIENKELIEEIVLLAKKYPKVREYYLHKIKPEYKKKILEKYKQEIKNEFFPSRGEPKLRFSVMRKALSNFKKMSDDDKAIIDLMLSHVEYGVEFTQRYGDIGDPFYDNIEKKFDKALKSIINHELKSYFYKRCKNIIKDAEGIGWGFSDNMKDLFYYYYEDFNI